MQYMNSVYIYNFVDKMTDNGFLPVAGFDMLFSPHH